MRGDEAVYDRVGGRAKMNLFVSGVGKGCVWGGGEGGGGGYEAVCEI